MPTQLIVNKDPRKLEAAVNKALTSVPKGKRRVLLTVIAGNNGEFVAVLADAAYVAGAAAPAVTTTPAAPSSVRATPKPVLEGPSSDSTRAPPPSKPKRSKRSSRSDGGEG